MPPSKEASRRVTGALVGVRRGRWRVGSLVDLGWRVEKAGRGIEEVEGRLKERDEKEETSDEADAAIASGWERRSKQRQGAQK